MEPANKSPLRWLKRAQKTVDDKTAVDFLPDADEIERRPLPREARITLHVLETLERTGGRRGMAAICIGGGLGGAMLVERV